MGNAAGLSPEITQSLQVQAAALRRTVSALHAQASATEQGLLRRLSQAEQAEQAQTAALTAELEQRSQQVRGHPAIRFQPKTTTQI